VICVVHAADTFPRGISNYCELSAQGKGNFGVSFKKGKQSEIASTSSACERVIAGKKVENGGN
jgi:hypothetical protein